MPVSSPSPASTDHTTKPITSQAAAMPTSIATSRPKPSAPTSTLRDSDRRSGASVCWYHCGSSWELPSEVEDSLGSGRVPRDIADFGGGGRGGGCATAAESVASHHRAL